MTGLYPHQAGMGHLDNTIFENSKGTQGRLRNDCVTMGEVLGDAGYFTIMTGKWHLGQNRGTPPWSRGFMRSLNSAIGEIYFPDQKQRREHGLHLNGKRHELDDPIFGEDWYGPDLLTEWGLKFVDEAKAPEKPFFWYFAALVDSLPAAWCRRPISIATAANTWPAGTSSAKRATGGKSKWGSSIPVGRSAAAAGCAGLGLAQRHRERPFRSHHGDLRGDDRSRGP